jgi:hypothetical protein
VRRAPRIPPFPTGLDQRQLRLGDIPGKALGIVIGDDRPRRRVPQDERRRPIGVAGCEERRHRTRIEVGEDGRAIRSRGIHHHTEVISPCLPRGNRVSGQRIGRSSAPAVEEDHTRERRETLVVAGEGRRVPTCVDVTRRASKGDKVTGSFTEDLVRDQTSIPRRVLSVGHTGV